MKYFGTDGIRGEYNQFLTPSLIVKACSGLSRILPANSCVVVGRDPRVSSDEIFDIVHQVLNLSGVKVYDIGIVPTPVVSFMIKKLGADAGIMISASHNPYTDNGIKFFNSYGVKIDDELEAQIEAFINDPQPYEAPRAVTEYVNSYEDYFLMLKTIAPDLTGLRVILDCANGSSYEFAKNTFIRLGADVSVLNDQPDGYNINDNCGALHPNVLADYIKEHDFDCGFCYDGDADRLICIDHLGNILTGDHIMYLLSIYLHNHHRLHQNTLVTTVMSNLGLLTTLKEAGIKCEITSVGDRFVIQKMIEGDYNLGGEQSGHLILSDYVTTGDGILTSIFLSQLLMSNKHLFNDVINNLAIYPQKLVNINVNNKYLVMENAELLSKIEETNSQLDGQGRILIRPSGTEELVRVMGEANDPDLLCQIMDYFTNLVAKINVEK